MEWERLCWFCAKSETPWFWGLQNQDEKSFLGLQFSFLIETECRCASVTHNAATPGSDARPHAGHTEPLALQEAPDTEELGAITSASPPPRGWLCTVLMTTSRLHTLVLWSSVISHINRNLMAWSQGPQLGHEKPEPHQKGAIFYGCIVKFLNPGTIRN